MTLIERRLVDELQIQKLAAAYSHAVMRLDPAAAAAVYAQDGVLSAFYHPDLEGRDAVQGGLKAALEPLEFLTQSCTAGIIDVDGDAARATWTVVEIGKTRGKPGLICCFGVYEDRLVRTADGWRFAHRRFLPFYRGSIESQGKDYRPVELAQHYSPWPFLGAPWPGEAAPTEAATA